MLMKITWPKSSIVCEAFSRIDIIFPIQACDSHTKKKLHWPNLHRISSGTIEKALHNLLAYYLLNDIIVQNVWMPIVMQELLIQFSKHLINTSFSILNACSHLPKHNFYS